MKLWIAEQDCYVHVCINGRRFFFERLRGVTDGIVSISYEIVSALAGEQSDPVIVYIVDPSHDELHDFLPGDRVEVMPGTRIYFFTHEDV